MGVRAVAAGGTIVALVAAGVLIAPALLAHADPPTGGSTIVTETFTGASAPDPAWTVQGDACLTGAAAGSTPPAGSAQIPNCGAHRNGGATLPGLGVTPGYLQLTDLAGNAGGSVLYNKPVPASAGISITFDQFQYGGNGADGIGFFLVDGSTSLTATGGLGGSLGYAQRDNEPGIVGGYLGVGLDAFGNFWDDGEARGSGCPAGQRSPSTSSGAIAPNVISLRGPGAGTSGYCLLGATVRTPVTNANKPGTTLNGGSGTLRASTLTGSLRTVNIQITPVTVANPIPRVIVQVRYTPTGPWITELNIPAPPNTPSTYKFGLSASTGGSNDVHLIRAANIQTILPLPQLQLEKQVDRTAGTLPAVIVPGTSIPYQYTVTNAGTIPVSALSIADSRIPTASIACALTTLQPAPAVGSSTTCRGSYVVTAADAAAGSILNTATANAASAAGPVTSPEASATVSLTSSVALSKAVTTPAPYAVGQQVSFQYVVQNTGGSTLSTFTLTDNRMSAGAISCPLGTLAPGAQMTCTGSHVITAAQLNAQGFLVNTATVTAVTPIGQTVTSPPATAQIPVATDVGVTKIVNDSTPLVGDDVTFTVTATNNGPSVATNVVVTDQVPNYGPDSRLVYVSSTPSSGTYNPATGARAIPSIPVGGSATLSIVATVRSITAIANAASRTGMTQIDTNPANDKASVTLNPIVQTADLAITKTVVGNASVPVGSHATFRLTVTNLGPFAATNAAVLDTLPGSLTFVSATGDGSYSPATFTWSIGSLAVGQVVTLDITVTTTIVDTSTNLAVIRAGSTPPDPNPSNNSSTADLVVRPPIADLTIVKNVFPQTAVVGDTVTYQLAASNNGPEAVTGAFVDDLLPPGITATAVTVDRGTYDLATGRWTIGALAPGETLKAIVTATVDDAGTQVNTATMRDPIVTDPNEDNNSSSATVTTAQPTVDIGVTKAISLLQGGPSTRLPLNSLAEFTVTATNNPLATPATATDVMLRDQLPSNLTFVSATGDGTYDPATGEWTVGTLAPGASAVLIIRVIASTTGHTTNTVGLESLTQSDADPSNNSDSVDLDIVRLADLTISKSVAPVVARPGQTVTYTVTVTNNGPNASLDSYAFDPLMPAADITGFTAPPGTTFDPATRLWNLGGIPSGGSLTLTVDVLVRAQSGWFGNDVIVDDRQTIDPDFTNNEASASLHVPAADIRVQKAVDAPQAQLGDTVTFHVTVTNLGPDPAGVVQVDDLVPAGMTLVSATQSAGAYDPATGAWTLDSLDPVPPVRQAGPEETLTIVATASTLGTFINTAASDRTGSTPFDPDLTNNAQSAVVTVSPLPAVVTLSKTVSTPAAHVGDVFTYTLTVGNNGPADAENVQLDDPMPQGIVALTVDDTRCTLIQTAVSCDFGTLSPGSSIAIHVTAQATASGDYPNHAVAATTTPDPTPETGEASADITINEPAPVPPSGGGEPSASGALSGTGTDIGGPLGWAVVLLAVGSAMSVVEIIRRRRRHGRG
ncbi:hypothetical protein [Leifsonia sp. NPDC058248]|uniref:DUF7507 domain-containing protein n=1 Tax=Leifsonia sp. NPDC058248 TaxID=3346402 RepID=UPI0036D8B326